MKYFCILVLALFISVQSRGQESPLLDRITLNTGEVYIGEIVVKTADMVMIKIFDGTRYQFQLTEVKQIEKIAADSKSSKQSVNYVNPVQSQGNFSGQLEFTGGISGARYAFTSALNEQFSLTFGNKQAFGRNLFLGVGVGYNNTFIESTSTSMGMIPVFVRIQNTLTKDRTAPYIGLDAGYSFSIIPDFKGGTLLKFSFGLTHRLNYKTSFIVGIYGGLNQIYGPLVETNNLGSFSYSGNTSMLNLGVKTGLQF